jgi:hypothetical protein
MLVKDVNNTTNYQNQPSPDEKNYPPFCSFIFPTNHRFIYFTMMPQMTSEEEGPLAEFSTAEHSSTKHCKATHYVGSKTTIKSNYLKMNYKIRIRN